MPKKASTIVLVENEFATLWFHPKTRIVHHQIHKFMSAGSYRDLLTAGVRCMEKHGAMKWLSDNRGNPVVSKDDDHWRSTVFMPRALRAGFKYWAVVMPAKPIGKMQVRAWIAELEALGVTLQVFEDADESMKWLESAGERRRTSGGHADL